MDISALILAPNEINKTTFLSSTLKVIENKVVLVFHFKQKLPSYFVAADSSAVPIIVPTIIVLHKSNIDL